ncbi:MAG TPA: MotA/TolQ/ExbB proton channel family protein [Abditibacteriaceae bacterium]|jgi:biopolymer transport protein ExbB
MGWIASHGGLVGLGILLAKAVLVLYSVVSVAVMIERVLTLKRVRQLEENEYSSLRNLLSRRNFDEAKTFVDAGSAPSTVALAAGLSHDDALPEVVRDAVAQEVVMQSNTLTHNLSVLGTVASTAPYIGLFGTVLGILDAFGRIAASGQTGARIVAAPIAEALTATALGLGVAIPAVMAYNYFSARVNDLSLRIENHALDLTSRLPHNRRVETHASDNGVVAESAGEGVATR